VIGAVTGAEALALIRATAAELNAGAVVLDLPESNRPLMEILLAQGFVESFRTARMYRGPAPEPGPALQAIATMELG
jgi:hypothetical protein